MNLRWFVAGLIVGAVVTMIGTVLALSTMISHHH